MILGEGVITFFNFLISGECLFCFEGRNCKVERVDNNTDCPDICFKVIAFPLENFRCDVVGSAADCALPLVGKL